MEKYLKLTKRMNDELLDVHQYKLDIWKEYVVFGWKWWFGVMLAIIPIIIWIKYHDKNLTAKLLIAGLTSIILSAFLDTTFLFFGMFDYRFEVTPMASNYLPWNFFTLPVLVMFTIQLFKNTNIYLKGIVLALCVSFIGLPILKMMGIFKLLNWNYFYSFLVFFIVFVLSHQMSKIVKVDND